MLAAEKAEAKIVKRTPVVGDVEHTKMEALRSMDFWTLFVSFLCGVGTNLVVVNNMVQGTFNLEEKMLLDLFNDGDLNVVVKGGCFERKEKYFLKMKIH